MMTFSFKSLASAVCALAVVAFLSVAIVDATSIARVHRTGGADFLASVSALVR
jgi:hypothetical protein